MDFLKSAEGIGQRAEGRGQRTKGRGQRTKGIEHREKQEYSEIMETFKYDSDERIVMTLDAGGTNFVFSAVQANEEIIEPVRLPSNASDLDRCLETITKGFMQVRESVSVLPAAISFAFPGPADYPSGIIGDLTNLPAFRGGIALGPMLEEQFKIPVFLNNDGDLFVYGEAIAGFLPWLNSLLSEKDSPKRYRNLFGITLGTGFGAGIVYDGQLYLGDNSAAAEIWCLRNKLHPDSFAEEGASIRAVQRVYMDKSGLPGNELPNPKEIFEIGTGEKEGNRQAALEAFKELGIVVGDALANAITLLDAPIVVGGGLTGASSLFLPSLVNEMNSQLQSINGEKVPRIDMKTFNLEDYNELEQFLAGEKKEVTIPGTNRKITFDPLKRTGIGLSRLGTSKAVGIGAYAYALSMLDRG
jgi:glucokinase